MSVRIVSLLRANYESFLSRSAFQIFKRYYNEWIDVRRLYPVTPVKLKLIN
jgi:hypothetical protein